MTELSGGELQRVCLAATLALEPRLLLLDEPTSQLDPEAAEALLELAVRLARDRGTTVLLSEQRPALPLTLCDRVLFLEDGHLEFDGPVDQARAWLEEHQPSFVSAGGDVGGHLHHFGEVACRLDRVSYAYQDHLLVVDGASLELRRGEIVALVGRNGSGKTTLAKIADELNRDQVPTAQGGKRWYPSTVRAVLGSAGYEVRICEEPKRFESDLTAFRPELVLMDIVLPGISGYDLARYVRQDERYAARGTRGALTVRSSRKEMNTRTEAPMKDAR